MLQIKSSVKLLFPLFLLVFIGLNAQKTSFIIKEGNSELQNKIGSFENQYLDGIVDNATTADSKVLSSILDLSNLKIAPEDKEPYLHLKFKKDKEQNVIISSASWQVSFERIDDSTTKVSVKLWSIIPDEKSSKFLNVKKSVTSGRLEKELKTFFEH